MIVFMCPAHPELSIDGDHGEEQHHSQRAPEVRVVSDHLPVIPQGRHWHQHTADLVVDVLQVDVQLLPSHTDTTTSERHKVTLTLARGYHRINLFTKERR